MAIESAAFLRRLARIVMLVLIVAFLECVSVAAQTPVMVGSIVDNGITASENIGQIYKTVIAPNGLILFLDAQWGALYELVPGSQTPITLSGPGQVLRGNQAFWNSSMVLDKWNNLYIGSVYDSSGQPELYRVPYVPGKNGAPGTWPLTGSDFWAQGDGLQLPSTDWGVEQLAYSDDGYLYISTTNPPAIWKVSVAEDGTAGTPIELVSGLKDNAPKIEVDHAGNLYFIENPWDSRNTVAAGLWMLPAGKSGAVGEKSPVVRLDDPALAYQFKGVGVDAAGDLLLSSSNDLAEGDSGYGGNFDGVLLVPNESGSPTTADAAHFNWGHSVLLSPATAASQAIIDPRGYLIHPTGTGGWAPVYSQEATPPVYPGTMNYVIYSLGSVNLGASPVGMAGATGSVFVTFNNSSTTIGKIVLTEPNGASDFVPVTTNPVLNAATKTTPISVDDTVVPCTVGTTYTEGQSCPYWLAVKPGVTGPVAGQLQIYDSNNKLVSSTFIYGEGQGAEVSALGSPNLLSIGSSFTKPAQVAVDTAGATYVADPGQGKVLQYAAGSSTAVSIGTGLTAPTGVAVDGYGNVYIGDSGKVIEVPYVSGALSAAGQTTLLESSSSAPLGSQLNLAVDGAGNVFVADEANSHVVRIPNSPSQSTIFRETVTDVNLAMLGGFQAPSAVAVDASGDLFVADKTDLYEVTPLDGQSSITSSLSGVGGLAVDASGSVYVAESKGLIRIPAEGGVLTVNHAFTIESGAVVTPSSVALDRTGNVYVSYTSSTGTPSVAEVSVNGNYPFGEVPALLLSTADIQLFNTGNLPLTFNPAASDLFTGTNAGDFSVQTAGDSPVCDTSATSPASTASGVYCFFGLGVAPSVLSGTESASLAISSNATNAPLLNVGLTDSPEQDKRPATAITISPIATVTYPGSVSITLTVTSADSACGTPQGTVILAVNNGVGKSTATLGSNGTFTFDPTTYPALSNLQGGVYNVNATYKGEDTPMTCAASAAPQTSFTVSPAVPTASVTTPDRYILLGGTEAINVTVVTLVKGNLPPSGTVAFKNGTTTVKTITLSGSGTATFDTKILPLGTYDLKAVYSGDANYESRTLPISEFLIINQSVLITASPSSLSLAPGASGSVTLTLQGLVGFGGTDFAVLLLCDPATLPKYAECSFDTAVVPMYTAGGSATVALTISTNVITSAEVRSGPTPWALAGIFGFGLIGLAFGRKTRFNGRALSIICLLLLFTGAVFGVTACTNSGYTHTPARPVDVTPAGTSNVSVTTTFRGNIVSLPFTLPVTVTAK